MPTTITLKNVPDEVYARLKCSAESHRRSINNEAIVCLEAVLVPARISPQERLQRARAMREKLGATFAAKEIDRFKRAGRE